MLVMSEPREILSIFQTSDSLFIAFCCLCQHLDNVSCRPILECLPKICQFVNLFQLRLVMNSSLELFPKQAPVQDVAVKSWNLTSGEVYSGHRRRFKFIVFKLFLRLLHHSAGNGYSQIKQIAFDMRGSFIASFIVIERQDFPFDTFKFRL